MFLIDNITSDALQRQTLVLEDGSSVVIEMYFRPLQQGWFFNVVSRGTFVLRGLRICNSPNMLYQFKNIIPFGLACYSAGNREPELPEDFSSGVSKLYVLGLDEMKGLEEFYQNG